MTRKMVLAVCVALLSWVGAHAQTSVVTTTGLTANQCVYAIGSSDIEQLGCSGRKNIINLSGARTLLNSECGSVVNGGSAASYVVTMPSSPLNNCEFTFAPGTSNIYVDFNTQTANLPGYEGSVAQWKIPDVSTYRTNNGSVSVILSYDHWEQVGFASPIFDTTMQSKNASQLENGQVYFLWNSSTSQFNLCPLNGPGGIIVDGAMRQVPKECLTLAQSETTPAQLNYFYAVHDGNDNLSVQNVQVDATTGLIELTFTASVIGNVNDKIAITCHSIGGAIQANGSDTGNIVSSTQIELLNTPSSPLGSYTTGGTCQVVRLAASTTGHFTADNGVQQMTGGTGHYTLVGMCQIGSSNTVSDTSSERDCTSWYNRGLKTCINKFTTDRTTTSTSYVEVDSEIRCGFVTWGTGDPMARSDLSWSISGMMKNGTSGDGAAVSAGFDPTPLAETEESAVVNPALSVGGGVPAPVRGSKTGLSEGKHYITLLGKAITGGTATFFGSTPHTSLEIRIPQ